MTWWLWILAGLVLMVAEVVAPGGIIMLFFGVAALIVGALVAAGLGGPVWFQWLLFSILSIVSLVTLRGPILRRMRGKVTRSAQVDSLVGKPVVLITDLAPGAEGKVELRGTSWTAKNIDDRTLSKGQQCKVDRVDGLKLFVRSA
jgi:membrane protein implicated in regulation of membrane protease activity